MGKSRLKKTEVVNTVKGHEDFEEGETVTDALDEEEFSTDRGLPSKGSGNWNIGLEIKVCSSLKRISPLCF